MDKRIETHTHYIFFSLLILTQVFFLLFNSATYGGADNVGHYQIAKYSFDHPKLFLDLWGKPVYTTLSSIFTLFGYKVAEAFNLIIAVLTLLLLSKLSNKIFPGSSLIALVLTAFAPVYFLLMPTCLTEILFSFTLAAAIYLFAKNKLLLSALVLSFIPFVRTEGYIFLPIFAVVFLLKRNYLSVLSLTAGTILYSVIGFFVFGDLLWIIHKMPYSMGTSIYGSGSLFHFVKNSNFIFGIPFLVLLVIGLVYWSYQLIRNFSFKNEQLFLYLLIVGSWFGYFAAHSYVWWKGTGGSLGLIRVIGGVIPVAALTCIKGVEFIYSTLKSKKLANGVIVSFSILQIILLFSQTSLPLKADPTEQLIEKCANYIRYNEAGKKVYYFDPLLIHDLEIDPYDTKQCNWGVGDKTQPSNNMTWGDLLVWDAHFGPNEGGVQLSNLEKDPYLKRIKSFYPLENIKVLGGYDYSVQVFKKTINKADSIVVSDNYKKVLSFEDYLDKRVKEVDGYKVWELDSSQEFSPTVTLSPDVVKRYEIIEFEVILDYKAVQPLKPNQLLMVFSVENNNEKLRYETEDLISKGSEWEKLQLNVKMPSSIPKTSKVLVYVWNKDKKKILIKNLTVAVKSY